MFIAEVLCMLVLAFFETVLVSLAALCRVSLDHFKFAIDRLSFM